MSQVVALLAVMALLVLALPLARLRDAALPWYRGLLRATLLLLIVAGGVLVVRPDLLPAAFAEWQSSWSPDYQERLPGPDSPAWGAILAALATAILLPILWLLGGQAIHRDDVTSKEETDAPRLRSRAADRDGIRATDIRSAAQSMTQAGKAQGRPHRLADYL